MATPIFSSIQAHTSATVDTVEAICPNDMRVITIYTDGSCKRPQDVGGWAFAAFNCNNELLVEQAEMVPVCTNNICEILAVIRALEWAIETQNTKKVSLHIYADSQYVINGATQWLEMWKRKNWLTAKKEPVKNRDVWEALDSLLPQVNVSFFWTKGHADDVRNIRVDELAGATWKLK